MRDISYASGARTRGGRLVIRTIENATGRIGLIRRARGFEDDLSAGATLWEALSLRYGLRLEVVSGALDNIPRSGPVVVVANHPYGILDGFMMGHILAERRPEFRILANSVFCRAEALERVILPISFDTTRAAQEINLRSRAEAQAHLAQGGAIGVFPGGTVSTAARPFAHPMDPDWRTFTAKLVVRTGATVVPLYFEGHNSRLFQLASHLHQTLRLALLVKEFRARISRPVRVAVGEPLPPDALMRFRQDPKGMMDFLRRATYDLSPGRPGHYERGHEFDARYKG